MRGIYAIVNRASGKFYIGSAVDVHIRWLHHRSALQRGDHVNRHLRSAWRKYGEDAFVCVLLEAVADAARLVEREQAWLDSSDAADPSVGYNLSPSAGMTLGYRFTADQIEKVRKPKSVEHRANIWRSREVTEAHRRQMAALGRSSAGIPKSSEHRRKISVAQRGSANHAAKLTERTVLEIKQRLARGERGRHLASEFGISEGIVSEIKHGKRWRHIEAAA